MSGTLGELLELEEGAEGFGAYLYVKTTSDKKDRINDHVSSFDF